MNRTIGVRFITTIDELRNSWENSQFELSAKYQYEGVIKHVWDYYLVFCCDFNEDDIKKRLRFKIESDRFCCRKYFLFGLSNQQFSTDKLISRLFPLIKSTKEIQIVKPETIIQHFDKDLRSLVTPSFFTQQFSEEEVELLIETMISQEALKNE